MDILIYTPGFNIHTGGIIVLHKLCHLLRKRGKQTFLWISDDKFNTCEIYDTPIGNNKIDPTQAIVIYPEIVTGNPLNGQKVVRWILGTPEFWGFPFSYENSDILISFSGYFSKTIPNCQQLFVFESWNKIFFPVPSSKREGICYTVRKGHLKPKIPETENALEIKAGEHSLRELAAIFRTKEVFYSYDVATFLSLQAVLCGCLSIVIPEEGLTKEIWQESFPLLKYGVGYGIQDIDWAKNSMNFVPQYLQEMEEDSSEQLDKFIQILG